MNVIQKDEIFEHLSRFLQQKGIELKDGGYTQAIRKSCGFLTEVVNLGQQGLEKAKGELDRRLDQARRVIHEKTASKAPARPAETASAPAPASQKKSRRATRSKAKNAPARRAPGRKRA